MKKQTYLKKGTKLTKIHRLYVPPCQKVQVCAQAFAIDFNPLIDAEFYIDISKVEKIGQPPKRIRRLV